MPNDRRLTRAATLLTLTCIAPLAFGVVLIVVMLAAPQGVVGTIRLKLLTRQAGRASGGANR